MNADKRPNPDNILDAIEIERRQSGRGALKIFFGASAGVGKTYAMLQEAQVLKADGVNVIVGLVETHKRPETEKILSGLTILPRKSINYKDVELEEFDIDAALILKPTLILVDEFAHTNAPGSRHPKRWQDIEELLNAGINVYTTLNVQHLEGFNDVINNVTGINVYETVPDSIFDQADEIQLIDIPTEDLLERLKEGHVYAAAGAAERAAENFFTKTNLMSLRELALRRTAEHVDADTDYERIQAGIFTPNIAGDRVLACLGPGHLSLRVARSARRIAGSLRAPWYALHVDSSRIEMNEKAQNYLRRALIISGQNGAQTATIQEDKVGDAILDFARNKGITKIVVGRNIRPPWMDWIFGSLVEYLIRYSGNIDVYVITGSQESTKKKKSFFEIGKLKHYFLSILITIVCTAIGIVLDPLFEPIDIVMIYLIGVVAVAARFGLYPALLSSVVGVTSFNFFFIDPLHSFSVADSSYWLTFLVMLLTAIAIGYQTELLRSQTLRARKREQETKLFFDLTRDMAAAREKKVIIAVALKHLQEALVGKASLWLRRADERFDITGNDDTEEMMKEEFVATWACNHSQSTGKGTDTLPSAVNYYQPINGINNAYGVISYKPEGIKDVSLSEKALLATFAHLLSSALDRVSSASSAETMRLERESEVLKNTLLSSMSHDLRTPLTALRGSAETLLNNELPKEAQKELLTSIYTEADRLTQVMNNLLDLTRFETGKIKLNEEGYYIQEVIGSAIQSLETILKDHHIISLIPTNLPMIQMDALLLEQVFQNLLDNAASFSPIKSTITIRAEHNSSGITIAIDDEGSGIPEGTEALVFDKFYTTERQNKPKGTGLGLAICQAIIAAHGGKIWAENNSKGGASFFVLLPLSRIVNMDSMEGMLE